MKANILKTLLAVVALIIGATACDDKGYWEPYNPEGVQYSFVNSELEEAFPMSLSADERYYTVRVRRSTDVGEVTLGLTLKAASSSNRYEPDEIFKIPESVTFEDGENTAEFKVFFTPKSRNYEYSCRVVFDEQTSPGGFNSITLVGSWIIPR